YSAMTFTGLNAVDGNGATSGDHLDASAFGDALSLTGSDNALQVGTGLILTNIDTASIVNLVGTAGSDAFSVTDTGVVSIYGLSIDGLDGVTGGGGSDSLSSISTLELIDSIQVALVDSDENQLVVFDGLSQLSAQTLLGTDATDNLQYNLNNNLVVNGYELLSITTVDTRGGADAMVGSGSDWAIQDASTLASEGISFTGLTSLDANGADLL
ncbi:hypothetical protein, partial [Microbulbifer agarilyticus]|uniref:hypothetical protein n=1 Tax=Microbulbifer agarilyticus TaxID=260552 RepID=UPI001CD72BCD